jgi:hypothetical protein
MHLVRCHQTNPGMVVNPFGAQAFRSRPSVWGWIADPIWASGHEPREQMPWGPAAGNLKSSP